MIQDSLKEIEEKLETKQKYMLEGRKQALGLDLPKDDNDIGGAWELSSNANQKTKASSVTNCKTSVRSHSRQSKKFEMIQ